MIKALGNTHSQARVSTGEMDLLTALGSQLGADQSQGLDPEIAALLGENGEMPIDFKEALKSMSAEDAEALIEGLNEQTLKAAQKQDTLNKQVEELIPQNVKRIAGNENSKANKDLQALLKNLPNEKLQAQQATKQNIASGETKAQTQGPKLQSTEGLMDLKSFMAQQSPTSKTRALNSQYKNEQQSMITNKAFAEKEVPVLGLGQAEGESEGSMDDLGQNNDQALLKMQKAPEGLSSNGKVFDVNSLSKSSDLDSAINQIQDYIIQAKAAKEPTAQMTFNHPELGDVDIFVKKAGDQINVTIGHQSQEAAKFFKQHQGELLQTLNQSGVQVGEFKLESSNSSQTNNQSQDQGEKQQFADQQKGQNQERQRKEDSQKREELWNLLNSERKTA